MSQSSSDYDIYIQRNYARGYTRKDLNVSFLRDQRIKIENFGDKIKERIGKGEKLLFSFLKSFGGERDWIFRPIKNVGKRAIRALSPPGSPKGELMNSFFYIFDVFISPISIAIAHFF